MLNNKGSAQAHLTHYTHKRKMELFAPEKGMSSYKEVADNGCENDVTQASCLPVNSARIPQSSIDVPSVSCCSTTVFSVKFNLVTDLPHRRQACDTKAAASRTSKVTGHSVSCGLTSRFVESCHNHRSLTVNQNTIALSSDRGSLEIAGVSLLYEGSRVKSYLLGRDLNPMGRGDGSLYAQGMFSAGNTRQMPNANPIGGFGNSVNNCSCGSGGSGGRCLLPGGRPGDLPIQPLILGQDYVMKKIKWRFIITIIADYLTFSALFGPLINDSLCNLIRSEPLNFEGLYMTVTWFPWVVSCAFTSFAVRYYFNNIKIHNRTYVLITAILIQLVLLYQLYYQLIPGYLAIAGLFLARW